MTSKKKYILITLILLFLFSTLSFLGYRFFVKEIKQPKNNVTDSYQRLYKSTGSLHSIGYFKAQITETYRTVEISGIFSGFYERDNLLYGIIKVPKDYRGDDITNADTIIVLFGDRNDNILTYYAKGFKEEERQTWMMKGVAEIETKLTEKTQIVAEVYTYMSSNNLCTDNECEKIYQYYKKHEIGNLLLDKLIYQNDGGKNEFDEIIVGPMSRLLMGVE